MTVAEPLAVRLSPERDRVYESLLAEIVEGDLPPGDRLIEAQLAERMGVSRTPVREALLRLERDGFVVSELHRGFAVSLPGEQTAREIYPMVGVLEGLAIVESGLALLKSSLEALKSANGKLEAARDQPRKAMDADAEFHGVLLRLCPNKRLLSAIDGLHKQVLRYERLHMSDTALIDVSIGQHAAIIEAIAAGDISAAERTVRANYASGLASVIVKLQSPADAASLTL